MPLLQIRRNEYNTATLAIDCPVCQAVDVTSLAQQIDERVMLFFLVQIFKTRTTFVRCGACGRSLSAGSITVDELCQLPPDKLGQQIRPYTSLFARTIVVISLLLFWFAFLSPILALAGLYLTRRDRKWKRIAIVALVLSLLVWAFLAYQIFGG